MNHYKEQIARGREHEKFIATDLSNVIWNSFLFLIGQGLYDQLSCQFAPF